MLVKIVSPSAVDMYDDVKFISWESVVLDIEEWIEDPKKTNPDGVIVAYYMPEEGRVNLDHMLEWGEKSYFLPPYETEFSNVVTLEVYDPLQKKTTSAPFAPGLFVHLEFDDDGHSFQSLLVSSNYTI